VKERLSTFVSHALWDVMTETQLLPRELTVVADGAQNLRLSALFSNFSMRFFSPLKHIFTCTPLTNALFIYLPSMVQP
jgi:hypothetical protein